MLINQCALGVSTKDTGFLSFDTLGEWHDTEKGPRWQYVHLIHSKYMSKE